MEEIKKIEQEIKEKSEQVRKLKDKLIESKYKKLHEIIDPKRQSGDPEVEFINFFEDEDFNIRYRDSFQIPEELSFNFEEINGLVNLLGKQGYKEKEDFLIDCGPYHERSEILQTRLIIKIRAYCLCLSGYEHQEKGNITVIDTPRDLPDSIGNIITREDLKNLNHIGIGNNKGESFKEDELNSTIEEFRGKYGEDLIIAILQKANEKLSLQKQIDKAKDYEER